MMGNDLDIYFASTFQRKILLFLDQPYIILDQPVIHG